jgi:hypothetical protein
VLDLVGGWSDGCAADGFAAVEPDSLDSWTRSRGLLDRADAVALARLLVERAHAAGLAVAQKDAAELTGAGPGFDFAVAEDCGAYDECDLCQGLRRGAGGRVRRRAVRGGLCGGPARRHGPTARRGGGHARV